MRISEFAQKHNITVDTVRHYMELGLILPEKKGSHFTFNEACSADLQEIIWFRKVNFSLAQIQKIFSFKRLSHLPTAEHKEYTIAMLLRQRDALVEERSKLEWKISEINQRVASVHQFEPISVDMPKQLTNSLGVPLGFLPYLACPKCQGPLKLHKGVIENDLVLCGELGCSCGLRIPIVDGIVKSSGIEPVVRDNIAPQNDSTEQYVEKTAVEFVNFMYKGVQWIINRLNPSTQSRKVILELGTGSGIFLRHFHDFLPQDGFYVITDNDIARLQEVKAHLEENSAYPNFVFICADFLELPLKNEFADIVIDFWGSTNYNFTHPEFLIELLDCKVKTSGAWIGSYAYFNPSAKSLLLYPPECRPYFDLPVLQRAFAQSSFTLLESEELGYVDKSGVYEPFFVQGDRCFQWAYYGEKIKTR